MRTRRQIWRHSTVNLSRPALPDQDGLPTTPWWMTAPTQEWPVAGSYPGDPAAGPVSVDPLSPAGAVADGSDPYCGWAPDGWSVLDEVLDALRDALDAGAERDRRRHRNGWWRG